MGNLLPLTVLAILVALIFGILLKKNQPKANHKYYCRRPLTENEQVMYWRLVRALPDHIVLAQVAMSRCIATKTKAAFGTISQKSLDFVICDKSSAIIAAIEIDDETHRAKSRAKADATKDAALKAAGIRCIRWPAKNLPNEKEIRDVLTAVTPRTNGTRSSCLESA